MGKLRDFIIKVVTSSTFKRFLWNTFNGFLGIIIIALSDFDWMYAPIVIAILNGITKEINKKLSK